MSAGFFYESQALKDEKMSVKIFSMFSTLWLLSAVPALGQDKFHHPDLTPPALKTAIVRKDNDYKFNPPFEDKTSRRVALPSLVREKICSLTLKRFRAEIYEGVTKYSDLFGPVFRINMPNASKSHSRHLYVYKLVGQGTLSDNTVLLVHDAESNRVTQKPVIVSGRWMYAEGRKNRGKVRPPLVAFDDINLDGRPEIVFKRIIHNGTCMDAAVSHYYHVAGDLSLKPIFQLEINSDNYPYFPIPTGGSDLKYMVRTVKKLPPNQIRIDVSLSSDPTRPGTQKVGHAIFEAPPPPAPLKLKETVAYPVQGPLKIRTLDYSKILLDSWLSPFRHQP